MKIVLIPNSVLVTATQPIIQFDKKLDHIIDQMIHVLQRQTDPPGVGLAAPQVGLSLQMFILKPNQKSKPEIFINPSIKSQILNPKSKSNPKSKKGKKENLRLEGCLSIPRIWGEVKRAAKIQLEYYTSSGEKKVEWFAGFKSVIIQHEMDHLNGILFTQRVLEQKHDLFEEKGDELVKFKELI